MDLPPLEPCPAHKRGAHELSIVVPESSDLDITTICSHCGAIRRVPASGALLTGRLDDLDAETIRAVAGDSLWKR